LGELEEWKKRIMMMTITIPSPRARFQSAFEAIH
jgi:hypothetical protein